MLRPTCASSAPGIRSCCSAAVAISPRSWRILRRTLDKQIRAVRPHPVLRVAVRLRRLEFWAASGQEDAGEAVNRRGFLGLLGGTAAAVLIADALPSSKTFFLPPAGGWRPSDLTEASIEALCRRIVAQVKQEGSAILYDQDIDMVMVPSRIHNADTLALGSKYRVIREEIEDLTDWPMLRLRA